MKFLRKRLQKDAEGINEEGGEAEKHACRGSNRDSPALVANTLLSNDLQTVLSYRSDPPRQVLNIKHGGYFADGYTVAAGVLRR